MENILYVSYMSLMRYRAVEKKDRLLHQPESEVIRANLSGERQPLDPVWKKMIGAGYAKDILFEVVQRGLERGVREIGFEGFLLHGIFHDELGVCRRERDGSLRFNFAYMDIILDFLVEKLNVVPWIVLDYTPLCLIRDADIRQFGDHIMNLPENLEEWSLLIETVLKHMTEVYGKQRVSGWKFSMEQAMQVSVGNCGMEDYKAFYLATFQAIKSVLPKAVVFGFGLDTGFVELAGKRELEELLVFAKEKDCLPDFLSFQCFFCDYSKAENDRADINHTEDEVYPMSENEDILAAELDSVEKIQKANGVEIPVAIMVSNPGMWGRNPGNDTCFRAAAFVKNAVENRSRLAVFASGSIPDYPEKLLPVKSMYHGGAGLLTYNGIPKAAYAGLQLLGSVKGEVAGEGKGYLLTCSPDRKEFYLLLYYYCPYDLARH